MRKRVLSKDPRHTSPWKRATILLGWKLGSGASWFPRVPHGSQIHHRNQLTAMNPQVEKAPEIIQSGDATMLDGSCHTRTLLANVKLHDFLAGAVARVLHLRRHENSTGALSLRTACRRVDAFWVCRLSCQREQRYHSSGARRLDFQRSQHSRLFATKSSSLRCG